MVAVSAHESSGPSCAPDLLPLTALPQLTLLGLYAVELGSNACFSLLTQLRVLILLGCEQPQSSRLPETGHELDELILRGSLEQLHLAMPRVSDHMSFASRLQSPGDRESPLITLLLSVNSDISLSHVHRFCNLKVLALMSVSSLDLAALKALTRLEALSLAGTSSPYGYQFRQLAEALSTLR